MDTILLCSGYPPATTYIHNTFIEDYMLSANGSYVKVYIYLSKCIQTGEKNLSISLLADKMDNTEKDILRALNYWEKNGLIHLIKNENSGEITGIEILNPGTHQELPPVESASQPVKKTGHHGSINKPKTDKADTMPAQDTGGSFNTEPPVKETPYKEITSTAKNAMLEEKTTDTAATKESTNNTPSVKNIDINITAAQLEKLASNEEFIWTSRVIENYVNRPLSPGEIQLISYLYDNLNFSPDLLLYLYEYCISINKTNLKYIQAVALSWHEQNIKNPEDAKNASSNYKSTYTAIAKAFALGRPLAMIEKQFASRWLDEWHMDLAVILDACSRTMLKFQKADFKYTEGILASWHKNNIQTMQDVEKADEVYAMKKTAMPNKRQHNNMQSSYKSKNQFNNFPQREVSQEEMDELEKKLLAR